MMCGVRIDDVRVCATNRQVKTIPLEGLRMTVTPLVADFTEVLLGDPSWRVEDDKQRIILKNVSTKYCIGDLVVD
jgi:hypothetical protein